MSWMVFDSTQRGPYQMSDETTAKNAMEIRTEKGVYEILIDWVGLLMWRWVSDPNYIVTYIYVDEEGAK